MNQSERRRFLIQELLQEDIRYREIKVPEQEEEQKRLLRGLMNIRLPKRISREFLAVQDEYLRAETAAKGITELDELEPISKGLYLWQGDITTLRCDAIVNAANSGMTGCYVPNHRCIDNAIPFSITQSCMQSRTAHPEYCRDLPTPKKQAEHTR